MRVYDGGLLTGTVVAALTGYLAPPPIVTNASELAFYFESDYSVQRTGVQATYIISLCPYNCSGRGDCVGGACQCAAGYVGAGCESALCPNNCTGNGDCVLTGGGTAGGCVCAAGRKGPDCSVPAATPMWRSDLHPPPPRALIGARGVYDAVDDMVRAPVCAHPNPKQPLNTGS